MNIIIVKNRIFRKELQNIAKNQFGDWIKVVVDGEKDIMAVGGELHADEEALLLENGSEEKNLWGANLFLEKDYDDNERIVYDSMINIKPSQGNRGRVIESQAIRDQIKNVINKLVIW